MSADTDAALSSLKDFQRLTVDAVCARMLDGDARRFLVADEVGLGKTLVARGVVARTVERLRTNGVRRVDVVYVCSNQEIARQNLDRLRLPGRDDVALPSRITLLPLHLAQFAEEGVNFVSFTPGTSFEPRSRGGWTQERALILHMLTEPWRLGRHRGIIEVFRVGARAASLKWELEHLGEPNADISRDFAAAMADSPLRAELERLAEIARRRSLNGDELTERLELIGQLRRDLARVCVDALEPDLVILDEFQRFAELLDGESDAAELAHQLFAFENDRGEFARVLMLSATPYRSFSHSAEDGTAHHQELRRLLGFLYDSPKRADEVQRQLHAMRECLVGRAPEDAELDRARETLEASLREVMVRTERLASSATRNGMLAVRPVNGFALEEKDVRQWAALARLHRMLRDRELLTSSTAIAEFWKSSPWLAQFMDGYAFKRAVTAAGQLNLDDDPELRAALGAVRGQLDWAAFRLYDDLAPANARIRALCADTVGVSWDLLWMPAALPYYAPGPPYDRPGTNALTKRLVFSSWNVVPRAIAGYLSYEAERRAQRAMDVAAINTTESRKVHERRLLDFKVQRLDGDIVRVASMPILAWLAPSESLAELGDVRAMARAHAGDHGPSADDIRQEVGGRIRDRLAMIDVPVDEGRQGPDQRWYWAAPLLLDRAGAATTTLWDQRDLVARWAEGHVGGVENFQQHVAEAQTVVREGIALGRQPDDLIDVLADLAMGGPGNAALRAVSAVLPDADDDGARMAAARVAWGLRQLFNGPEAIAIVSSLGLQTPYWRQALRYAVNGNLQAVLDEWLHLAAEDAGTGRDDPGAVLQTLLKRVLLALGLGASRVEVDPVDGDEQVAWRTQFAVRYGQAKEESSVQSVHPEAVRCAFNSPLRPFVLASTSVGQEGLDFHTYCHAIVHWNLPSNPVDLEQREGRIHRYKGHAVRRNVAERHRDVAMADPESDPWAAAFDAALTSRDADQDDLVPFWLMPGTAKIERYVPALPFSRDEERYARVLRQVTLYRMVFGQPRQDDLIAYLQETVGQGEAERLAGLVRVDLAPRSQGPGSWQNVGTNSTGGEPAFPRSRR
jgi:hypothetical protein